MSPRVTNKEAWSSRLGVWRGVDTPSVKLLWPITGCHAKDDDDDDDDDWYRFTRISEIYKHFIMQEVVIA
jgi:hypothetical protein